jgi:hypothetical protein
MRGLPERQGGYSSSDDDVPLSADQPTFRPARPIEDEDNGRTAYLITPMRNKPRASAPPQPTRHHELRPPTPTPPYTLRPLKNPITRAHLKADAKREFFINLGSLLKYADVQGNKINLEKINGRVQEMAFYGIYPEAESLGVLIASEDKGDRLVSVLNQELSFGTSDM